MQRGILLSGGLIAGVLMAGVGVLLAETGILSGLPRSHTAATTVANEVKVIHIAPRFHLLSNASGNLVIYIDDTASLIAGTQAPALVYAARAYLASHHAPPVRYALILQSDSAGIFGDGGWGSQGALTIADENLRHDIARYVNARARTDAITTVGVPLIGFSGVVQLYLAHAEPHFAHQAPALTLKDVVIHFEKANIALVGDMITPDEYPEFPDVPEYPGIPLMGRRRLQALLANIDWFANGLPSAVVKTIVAGRGRPLTQADLRAYEEMLHLMMARVDSLRVLGKSESEIISAHLSSDFDPQWGHGRVSADQFVGSLYRVLSRE